VDGILLAVEMLSVHDYLGGGCGPVVGRNADAFDDPSAALALVATPGDSTTWPSSRADYVSAATDADGRGTDALAGTELLPDMRSAFHWIRAVPIGCCFS
jgi:hypothetical protein